MADTNVIGAESPIDSPQRQRPIFVATHPRACSTAFERVFMTRTDILSCAHEPFGDAYYFGPERMGERYEESIALRNNSGFRDTTYQDVLDGINEANVEGKRVLLKDMAQYLIPTNMQPAWIAPSLLRHKHGVGTYDASKKKRDGKKDSELLTYILRDPTKPSGPGRIHELKFRKNPTVFPTELLDQFHFTFLIRHPRYSVPSYYRCTQPPLDKVTGFYNFRPDEAGYAELRRLFDYLREMGEIGPEIVGRKGTVNGHVNGETNGESHDGHPIKAIDNVPICVIDADDLLDNPDGVISTFCEAVGIDYSPKMLNWGESESQADVRKIFAKWKGFHEDAIDSKDLKPRKHKKIPKSDEELFKEWTEKYSEAEAKVIQQTVAENVEHYEYLKQFAMQV